MAWNKNTNPEKIKEYNRQYYLKKTKEKMEQAKVKLEPKECPICHATFTPERSNQKYCCSACKKLANKIAKLIYSRTDKYKEMQKEYRQTESFKESQRAYRESEKGKLARKEYLKEYSKSEVYKKAQKKYAESEKGKATRQKYDQSEKGKVAKQKYDQSEKGKANHKRYYEKRKANGGKALREKEEE